MPPMHLDEGSRAPERGGREPSSAAIGRPPVARADGSGLLRALASPDEEDAKLALGQWKDLLEQKLVRAVYRLIQSDADAEEIATDAFLRLWKHRGRFAAAADSGYNNPWRWLWEVSKRLVASRLRYRSARKRGSDRQPVTLEDAGLLTPNPEPGYLQSIACERFRDELSPVERVIWDMHKDGHSVKDISSALRETTTPLTPKQVRSRLEVMRDHFATLLGLGSS